MQLQCLVELKDFIEVASFAEVSMCDDMPEEVRCLTRGRETADAAGLRRKGRDQRGGSIISKTPSAPTHITYGEQEGFFGLRYGIL